MSEAFLGLKQCPIFKEKGDFHVTSPYGTRVHPISGVVQFHSGVDGVRNTSSIATIVAIEDGTVIDSDTSVEGFSTERSKGNYVRLLHASGRHSMYLHLAYGTVPVKPGQDVKKGQMLGMMGDTGNSTDCHIHFQVYDVDGKTIIDPTQFLTGRNINEREEDTMFVYVTPCKQGDKGEIVRNLQKKIAQLSKDLEAEVRDHSYKNGQFDGVYGAGMMLTVQRLQNDAGLEATGECDETFCDLLNNNVIDLANKITLAAKILNE